MITMMRRPRPTPNHTSSSVSIVRDFVGWWQADTNLPHELLVYGVMLVSECLLKECKQDRNHNAGFDTLPEADEEN